MIGIALSIVGTASATLVLVHGAWWTVLCTVAVRRPGSGAPATLDRSPSCAVVVPAHNEEALIGECVSSLLASAQVAGGATRVLVVADNCTDRTAEVARAAGATVIERSDPAQLGKPFALDFGLAWLGANEPPDFVAFVDGDCEVGLQFLPRVSARIAEGAEAVQGHYTTFEGGTSLQRLRRLALMLVHWSRPLGAQRLGIGTTLKGSGMGLRWELVRRGFGAHSVAED
ncbi:MAG: glycosyltransferase family 2 protein, partial [Tepidiformaceae bacterium]